MGLDSYIIKKYYIGANYERNQVTGTLEIFHRGKKLNLDLKEVRSIDSEVIHFERANMIHRWFVDHIQDGIDNCKQYYVEREQLKELLEMCNKVLEHRELAEGLLPTQDGCFFGNIEYNELYFQCLESCVKRLNELDLEGVDYSFEYYYESGW
jgi:hypothetical protein